MRQQLEEERAIGLEEDDIDDGGSDKDDDDDDDGDDDEGEAAEGDGGDDSGNAAADDGDEAVVVESDGVDAVLAGGSSPFHHRTSSGTAPGSNIGGCGSRRSPQLIERGRRRWGWRFSRWRVVACAGGCGWRGGAN